MWVRSEYTSELAVLAAWVSLLVPWNVVYHTRATVEGFPVVEGTVFFLRFAFFELQFRQDTIVEGELGIENVAELLEATYPGTELAANVYITSPPTSATFYDGTLWQASVLWTVAAAALALAFALSIALYFRTDETVERLPVSEVRLMGILLGIATVGMVGASVLYYLERDVVGTPVPAGVVVVGAFSLVLLRTKPLPEDEK